MTILIGIWNAIPLRVKIGALILVAFLLGLMRWKNQHVDAALEKMRSEATEKEMKRRIETFETAKEIENEVEALPDDELRRRAGKWVRAPRKPRER